MSTLRMTQLVYDEIRVHGEEAYPYECCGVLLGIPSEDGWWVAAAMRAGNARADSAENRYQIDPSELVKIEREANHQGMEIAGFYHSHPDHPAKWSTTDFAEAHWLGCSYVITTVTHGEATVTNSFRLSGATEEDKLFEEEKILVGEASLKPAGD